MTPRSLRTQLLFELGFLTSAAVLLVGVTTALIAGADLRDAAWPLGALWIGSTTVFLLFGRRLVGRLLLRPLSVLSTEADTLAAGELPEAPALYESTELTHLASRYRAMAESLLDIHSQVVRVEKLAGIGQLAAGVAHEVRNPLGALSSYVEVLRRRGVDPAVTGEMRHAIERIERTIQSLLEYARPAGSAAVDATDLGAAVRTTLDFLDAQGALREHTVRVELGEPLPAVAGDRHALEQVVVNLVLNACDAAPRGAIVVGAVARAFEVRVHEAPRRSDATTADAPRRRWTPRPRRVDLPPGAPGVLLYVADSGTGVPDADRERIFDPFFTTKDPGKGSGLGLAIVARTVHEAGGLVWVDRAREGGAVFKIFLPSAGKAHASSDRR